MIAQTYQLLPGNCKSTRILYPTGNFYCTLYINQSAESTDGLGLHIEGSRKLSSLSKHEVFEQLLQTLNGERMQNYQAM